MPWRSDPPELVASGEKAIGALRRVDSRDMRDGASAAGEKLLRERVCARRVNIVQHHLRATIGEQARVRASHAAARTGHDRDPIVEAHIHPLDRTDPEASSP